jgi:hypothetical protein
VTAPQPARLFIKCSQCAEHGAYKLKDRTRLCINHWIALKLRTTQGRVCHCGATATRFANGKAFCTQHRDLAVQEVSKAGHRYDKARNLGPDVWRAALIREEKIETPPDST